MNIAVVGAGWAGVAAAYQLSKDHQVTLFEASRQVGGRARRVRNTPLATLLITASIYCWAHMITP